MDSEVQTNGISKIINLSCSNYMLVCDEKEIAWEKVLNFDIASFINSLYSIIGANNDANMLLESFIIDVIIS